MTSFKVYDTQPTTFPVATQFVYGSFGRRTWRIQLSGGRTLIVSLNSKNASVTPSRKSHVMPWSQPLRKAASYEPRIAFLGIWGDTRLTRGKYRHLRGSYW